MRGSRPLPTAAAGLAFVALILAAHGMAAQGLPFFTPTALPLPLAENGIRAFYQHVEVRTPLQNGSEIANPTGMRVGVDAVPLMIPAGVTPHTVLMVVAPYLRKTFEQNGTTQTKSGLGDVTVMVRQDLLASDFVAGNRRLALFAGASLPTGATGDSATALPPPLRLGLGSVNLTGQAVYSYVDNRFGAHGAVGYTAATGDQFGVRPGDRFTYGLALGYRVATRCSSLPGSSSSRSRTGRSRHRSRFRSSGRSTARSSRPLGRWRSARGRCSTCSVADGRRR
jgi:hypothetical protein